MLFEDGLRLGLQVVNMIGTLAIGAWVYIERRSDKTNDRVTSLATRVEATERDVSALQQTAEGAPSHADLAKVYESINSLAATVHVLVGENRGQSDTLRLILNQITQKGLK